MNLSVLGSTGSIVRGTLEVVENFRRNGEDITVAALTGGDALVLGAFGCGVFENDARKTAQCFKEALESVDFKSRFERIVFPIFGRSPSGVWQGFEAIFGRGA